MREETENLARISNKTLRDLDGDAKNMFKN
jgi:hypothetical protein